MTPLCGPGRYPSYDTCLQRNDRDASSQTRIVGGVLTVINSAELIADGFHVHPVMMFIRCGPEQL